jgi:nitrilase
MKVAVVQMRSVEDPFENFLVVSQFVEEAIAAKASLVAFPENVFFRGSKSLASRDDALLGPDFKNPLGQLIRELWKQSQEAGMAILLGSVLWNENSHLPFNASLVLQRDRRLELYRKIHLFDYTQTYRESRDVSAGTELVAVSIGDWVWGLSICFDLRFPELYRQLVLEKGSDVLCVPAAFTQETGEKHWHTLLRARAIENLSYVVAPAQWGSHLSSHGQKLGCYGHALVVDPWGEIIAEAPASGDSLLLVSLDRGRLESCRERLPALHSTKLLKGRVETS